MIETRKCLTVSILSLSLLTVMAGAAVAPALGVIKDHFNYCDDAVIQMIISIPAIFIAITNFFVPKLCERFKSKTLLMAALAIYIIGGCVAGAFNNIYLVLIMRAFVGVSVGILMPLSTGLLSFYYPPQSQARLMGYSSAMNQMGGVIATLLSGVLASMSWRASFLVYLMGLLSAALCFFFLPNDRISAQKKSALVEGESGRRFKYKYKYIVAMFLLMSTFFVYPTSFAMEISADNIIPRQFIAPIMAGMDLVAFFGGLAFVGTKKIFKGYMRFLAPVLFFTGYLFLAFTTVWFGTIIGSVLIGFANGIGVPFIIAEGVIQVGKMAATVLMPFISAALYIAQFLSPILLSIVRTAFPEAHHLPYFFAAIVALAFLFWSGLFLPLKTAKNDVTN